MLEVIDRPEQLDKLRAYIASHEYLAFDTETTGVDRESKIIGFSLSGDVETGFYVILAYWDKYTMELKEHETAPHAKEILSLLLSKNLILHNAIFDCFMVRNNYGIDLMPAVHTDTMILSHLLDENRHNGLKELGVSIFGEEASAEQKEMKASVHANGGVLTKAKFELYKADQTILAKYGAKDAVLTIKLFYYLVEELYQQGLEKFFYDDESMPLLKGPTYDLNTTGLRVDLERLNKLEAELEGECEKDRAFVYKAIAPWVKDKYPGSSKKNTFNIDSTQQRSWLLFHIMGEEFHTLTETGRDICRSLHLKLPYTAKAKKEFKETCHTHLGQPYKHEKGKPIKIKEYWTYLKCDKEALDKYAHLHPWVGAYLRYTKNSKLLKTYVIGIKERVRYGVIRPHFLQHGTTSGRYSSKNPNFQNLPRKDKRIKACIVSRPGHVFVGADYSQLEPRVFASFSKDARLLAAFDGSSDFYSTIGIEVFEKYDATPQKDGSNDAFGVKYAHLRDIAKVVALSATYGTTPARMAPAIGKTIDEAEEVIQNYFTKFPKVKELMLSCHEQAKSHGVVYNLYGRPRRMPRALEIGEMFKSLPHENLPYEYRNILNLAINHTIQSTGASIMNRAAIAVWKECKHRGLSAKLVLQVHDELILECKEEEAVIVSTLLKDCMENTTSLPGVRLEALPKIGKSLSDIK